MRRFLVLFAAGLPTVAAAAWVGVALAQKDDPAKRLDDWKYPGATNIGSGGGSSGDFMVLATADGLEKVAAFYGKKVGAKLSADGSDGPGGRGMRSSDDGQATVFVDDSIQPGAGPTKPRPVTVRIFVRHAKDHDMTLILSRANGEEQTHISLAYFAK